MRPVIQEGEFAGRRAQIQEALGRRGLDLLIAYSDDRFTYGQAHARWICNYIPQFEPALVLIPARGEGILATGAESEAYAVACAKGMSVRVNDIFLHPNEEYPYAAVTPFAGTVGDLEDMLGRRIGKIGVVGDELIPHRLYEALRESFPGAEFFGFEAEMTRLRAVKSAAEIRVIEYAYQIGQAGMNAAVAALEVGRTEREIAAEAEYVMRRMGSEGMGIMTMVAAGMEHTRPILATTTGRAIAKGDLVCMTFAPRYEGYHGAIARPVVMGKPSAALQRALEASMRAQEETQALLRPGTRGCDLDRASRRFINEAGLGRHFVYTGVHSVGVVEFEPPIMTSEMLEEIQENMVLSVDIPLYLNDDFGGFRIENGFLITADGHRALNDLAVHYLK